jgi:hypothetical protein
MSTLLGRQLRKIVTEEQDGRIGGGSAGYQLRAWW